MEHINNNPPQPQTFPQPPKIVYLQPGQQAVYLQPGQEPTFPPPPPACDPQIHSSAPAWRQGQWVYQQAYALPATKPPSSGLRIASGVVGIAAGAWNLFMFLVLMAVDDRAVRQTPMLGWANFLHLVLSLALLTLGIMIIVKHRGRSRPIPSMLAGSAAAMVVVDFAVAHLNFAPRIATFTLAVALPTAALAALAIAMEEPGGGRR